jgi:hypothetical protein
MNKAELTPTADIERMHEPARAGGRVAKPSDSLGF